MLFQDTLSGKVQFYQCQPGQSIWLRTLLFRSWDAWSLMVTAMHVGLGRFCLILLVCTSSSPCFPRYVKIVGQSSSLHLSALAVAMWFVNNWTSHIATSMGKPFQECDCSVFFGVSHPKVSPIFMCWWLSAASHDIFAQSRQLHQHLTGS